METDLGSAGADKSRPRRAHPLHVFFEVTEADLCRSQGTRWKLPGIRRRSLLSCMQTKDQVKVSGGSLVIGAICFQSGGFLFLMFKSFDHNSLDPFFFLFAMLAAWLQRWQVSRPVGPLLWQTLKVVVLPWNFLQTFMVPRVWILVLSIRCLIMEAQNLLF